MKKEMKPFQIEKEKRDVALEKILDVLDEAKLNPAELINVTATVAAVAVSNLKYNKKVMETERDVLEKAYLGNLITASEAGDYVNFKDYINIETLTAEERTLPIVVRLMGLIRSGKITSMTRNIDVMRMIMAVDKEES